MGASPPPPANIAAAILAGGRARRLGGRDKALLPFATGTLLSAVLDRLRPQVRTIVLNANGDPARFAACGLPVVADDLPGFPGPLAGVLASLDWIARCDPEATHLVTTPCDTPFLPRDLVSRLGAAVTDRPGALAVAHSAAGPHPATALWPVALRTDLRAFLMTSGSGKVKAFQSSYDCIVLTWNDVPDPFLNINTEEDRAYAETAFDALRIKLHSGN